MMEFLKKFKDGVVNAIAEARKPIAERWISNAVEGPAPGDYAVPVPGGAVRIPPDAWENARLSGASFEDVIRKMNPKALQTLEWIVSNYGDVVVSSLWRPEASVHGEGRGIDIVKIGKMVLAKSSNAEQRPEGEYPLASALWDAGFLWQYISPWLVRGLVGDPRAYQWQHNLGDGYFSSVLRAHWSHLHLTVKP